ncbi:MAG TPA: phosphoadenylyl-sulfate reductase [Bacteroidales bacterium]|nr:phosphoadenylyl-sulfate reductase [Bacteroidales bacterium]
MKEKMLELNRRFANAPTEEVLDWFAGEYEGKIAFSTSLGAEDQVITRMIADAQLPVQVFTLDTGRLFQETYDLLDITVGKYGIPIRIYFPEPAHVEEMVAAKGVNLFYESVENRQLCCHIRKIEPLKRALSGMEVWITGMRKDQSVTRTGADLVEWDSSNQILKLNPLIRWSNDQVWDYIRKWQVPVSELHAKGFPSIGCLPCTRAVQPGEDIRAGRWWWENPASRECGLHKRHEGSGR